MSNNMKPDSNRVVQRPLTLPVLYIRYQSRGLSAGSEELNHTRTCLLGKTGAHHKARLFRINQIAAANEILPFQPVSRLSHCLVVTAFQVGGDPEVAMLRRSSVAATALLLASASSLAVISASRNVSPNT